MLLLSHQQLVKAIDERRSVRQYDGSRAVEADKLKVIAEVVDEVNSNHGELSFRLVCGEPRAFGGRWASYGNFRGVNNYIVVAGNKEKTTDLLCGSEGERIVLLMQHLGLSSCWVGLTYKRIEGAFEIPDDHAIRCLIAFGYREGESPKEHKSKTPEQVSNLSTESPEWFREGVRLALKAPTAVNQQKFYFEHTGGNDVTASPRFSLIGYSRIDLGIASLHFRIGANNPELNLSFK